MEAEDKKTEDHDDIETLLDLPETVKTKEDFIEWLLG